MRSYISMKNKYRQGPKVAIPTEVEWASDNIPPISKQSFYKSSLYNGITLPYIPVVFDKLIYLSFLKGVVG